MLLNTRHVADLLNISASTVKKYSGIYERYLTEAARPQDGSHRLFDTDDLRIFAYVVQQVKLGERHENIIMAIANGQRADLPPQHDEYSLTVDRAEQITMLQTRIMQLEGRLLELEGERDKRLELEGQNKLLKEQLKEAQREIIQLTLDLKYKY